MEILTERIEEFRQTTMSGARPAFEEIKKGCAKAEVSVEGLTEEVRDGAEALKEMDRAQEELEAFEGKIRSFLGLSGAV